jgi:hypothetical protein
MVEDTLAVVDHGRRRCDVGTVRRTVLRELPF